MGRSRAQIGVIGLGTMGSNLARNIARHGTLTLVTNRSRERLESFIAAHGSQTLTGVASLTELVAGLRAPRIVVLMVDAGVAVDAVLADLVPLLGRGDIIIDGGNSSYRDTQRRVQELHPRGLHLVGCGVSGGAEGALHGPSMMLGCDAETWEKLRPILEPLAASDAHGGPCVGRIGPDGAGHYVKMVHNGIEYAIMQTLAELVDILRGVFQLPLPRVAQVVRELNSGPLSSYLLEALDAVLRRRDPLSDGWLIESILDVAGQKGTGKWTARDALERGVPAPSIVEAVMARATSERRDLRRELSRLIPSRPLVATRYSAKHQERIAGALLASWISIYAQGYDLIQQASVSEEWGVDLAELSRLWQGGCIIRANLLQTLEEGYRVNPTASHLFALPPFASVLARTLPDLAEIVTAGSLVGIPLPGMGSALTYVQQVTRERLPAYVLQGLRDAFGAHTYERTDRGGTFTTDWTHGA